MIADIKVMSAFRQNGTYTYEILEKCILVVIGTFKSVVSVSSHDILFTRHT